MSLHPPVLPVTRSPSLPTEGTVKIPSLLQNFAQDLNNHYPARVSWDDEAFELAPEMVTNWDLPAEYTTSDYADWQVHPIPLIVVQPAEDGAECGYSQGELDAIHARMAHRKSGDTTAPSAPTPVTPTKPHAFSTSHSVHNSPLLTHHSTLRRNPSFPVTPPDSPTLVSQEHATLKISEVLPSLLNGYSQSSGMEDSDEEDIVIELDSHTQVKLSGNLKTCQKSQTLVQLIPTNGQSVDDKENTSPEAIGKAPSFRALQANSDIHPLPIADEGMGIGLSGSSALTGASVTLHSPGSVREEDQTPALPCSLKQSIKNPPDVAHSPRAPFPEWHATVTVSPIELQTHKNDGKSNHQAHCHDATPPLTPVTSLVAADAPGKKHVFKTSTPTQEHDNGIRTPRSLSPADGNQPSFAHSQDLITVKLPVPQSQLHKLPPKGLHILPRNVRVAEARSLSVGGGHSPPFLLFTVHGWDDEATAPGKDSSPVDSSLICESARPGSTSVPLHVRRPSAPIRQRDRSSTAWNSTTPEDVFIGHRLHSTSARPPLFELTKDDKSHILNYVDQQEEQARRVRLTRSLQNAHSKQVIDLVPTGSTEGSLGTTLGRKLDRISDLSPIQEAKDCSRPEEHLAQIGSEIEPLNSTSGTPHLDVRREGASRSTDKPLSIKGKAKMARATTASSAPPPRRQAAREADRAISLCQSKTSVAAVEVEKGKGKKREREWLPSPDPMESNYDEPLQPGSSLSAKRSKTSKAGGLLARKYTLEEITIIKGLANNATVSNFALWDAIQKALLAQGYMERTHVALKTQIRALGIRPSISKSSSAVADESIESAQHELVELGKVEGGDDDADGETDIEYEL